MRILILGASGQIGKALLTRCREDKTFNAMGTSLNRAGEYSADISAPEQLKKVFDSFKPDFAVVAAALTAVDYCESNPEKARLINVQGVSNVARECNNCGAKMLYLSTEYVFDGVSGPYSEEDTPKPISVYAQTKLDGEKAAAETAAGFIIARTTVVYSYDIDSKNFIMQLISRLGNEQTMTVPSDQYSNPTYAPDLAEMLIKLMLSGKTGIYNTVGPDRMNRYEFALKACKILGYDKNLLIPKTTAQLNQTAPRPLNAGLLIDKLVKETGHRPLNVETGLTEIKKLIKTSKACSK